MSAVELSAVMYAWACSASDMAPLAATVVSVNVMPTSGTRWSNTAAAALGVGAVRLHESSFQSSSTPGAASTSHSSSLSGLVWSLTHSTDPTNCAPGDDAGGSTVNDTPPAAVLLANGSDGWALPFSSPSHTNGAARGFTAVTLAHVCVSRQPNGEAADTREQLLSCTSMNAASANGSQKPFFAPAFWYHRHVSSPAASTHVSVYPFFSLRITSCGFSRRRRPVVE